MTKKALSVLNHVIREKPTRENRLTDLIKAPSLDHVEGWYMCVPPCFNDALDIRQTERVENKQKTLTWTQGSSFAFKAGDTLYDTPDAYKVWSEALKSINLCVQVKLGSSAGPLDGGTGRFAGSVTFSILTPNDYRSRLVERADHTMSQDDFIRFLIGGPPDEMLGKMKDPQQETGGDA